MQIPVQTNVQTNGFAEERGLHRLLHDRGMHLVEIAGPVQERPFGPAHRLAANILYQALVDLDDKSPVVRADAAWWFRCEDEDNTFSLVSICETLCFDAKNIRAIADDADRRRIVCARLAKEWKEGGQKEGGAQ